MAEWYADQLRNEAERKGDQIEALEKVLHGYLMLIDQASDNSPLHAFAATEIEKLEDQIGELRGDVEELDEMIDAEDPETPYRPIVL